MSEAVQGFAVAHDRLRARYPYELVKKAGVDLATAAPYQALMARMNSIMDQIEAILAKHH
jgi:oligoendopeptidase F